MAWQEDNRLRRESSAQIIKSGDHRRLVALIRLYRTKKKEFEDNNKKFFVADDKILKEAESTVTQEFCAVLGIDGESVIGMICE